MYKTNKQEKFSTRVIMVIAILMYSMVMWYAATSRKRWLGSGLDGPKRQWEQRMAAAGLNE